MPTVQILNQPQDTNGQSYPAMRVAAVHAATLAANTAVPFALLPQTKVVRVCGVSDVYARLSTAGTAALPANDPLVAAAHYQDFVVYPGEQISIVSIAGGQASVTEFA